MQKTSLNEIHRSNNAKMVEFAGWEMPVVFTGIREEHNAVRSKAGLFDVSHMGEIEIAGPQALELCQYLTTNDVSSLEDYQAQYTIVCNHEGGVLDDVIIYRMSGDRFFFCVNASNTPKIDKWFTEIAGDFDAQVYNKSALYSQIAIQGPESAGILKDVLGDSISSVKRFRFTFVQWKGAELMVARTGYTGENGYEVFLSWDMGPELWKSLYDAGRSSGIQYCGLGSRDTLRIEMAFPLYGHEISEEINPLEACLDRYVKLDRDDFIGREALTHAGRNGIARKLIGFEMTDRGIPREDYQLYNGDKNVGHVTSGTMSPTLGRGIGLGLVSASTSSDGDIFVEIRGKKRKAKIVELPFIKKTN